VPHRRDVGGGLGLAAIAAALLGLGLLPSFFLATAILAVYALVPECAVLWRHGKEPAKVTRALEKVAEAAVRAARGLAVELCALLPAVQPDDPRLVRLMQQALAAADAASADEDAKAQMQAAAERIHARETLAYPSDKQPLFMTRSVNAILNAMLVDLTSYAVREASRYTSHDGRRVNVTSIYQLALREMLASIGVTLSWQDATMRTAGPGVGETLYSDPRVQAEAHQSILDILALRKFCCRIKSNRVRDCCTAEMVKRRAIATGTLACHYRSTVGSFVCFVDAATGECKQLLSLGHAHPCAIEPRNNEGMQRKTAREHAALEDQFVRHVAAAKGEQYDAELTLARLQVARTWIHTSPSCPMMRPTSSARGDRCTPSGCDTRRRRWASMRTRTCPCWPRRSRPVTSSPRSGSSTIPSSRPTRRLRARSCASVCCSTASPAARRR
jgi:hypothetical protein